MEKYKAPLEKSKYFYNTFPLELRSGQQSAIKIPSQIIHK